MPLLSGMKCVADDKKSHPCSRINWVMYIYIYIYIYIISPGDCILHATVIRPQANTTPEAYDINIKKKNRMSHKRGSYDYYVMLVIMLCNWGLYDQTLYINTYINYTLIFTMLIINQQLTKTNKKKDYLYSNRYLHAGNNKRN